MRSRLDERGDGSQALGYSHIKRVDRSSSTTSTLFMQERYLSNVHVRLSHSMRRQMRLLPTISCFPVRPVMQVSHPIHTPSVIPCYHPHVNAVPEPLSASLHAMPRNSMFAFQCYSLISSPPCRAIRILNTLRYPRFFLFLCLVRVRGPFLEHPVHALHSVRCSRGVGKASFGETFAGFDAL